MFRRLPFTAGRAWLTSLAVGLGACVAPHRPAPVAPSAPRSVAPALAFWSPASTGNTLAFGMGANVAFLEVDRDAYVAAFTVDRSGRMRVLHPASPGASQRVRGGTPLPLNAWTASDPAFQFASGNNTRLVPFAFAIASARPIDLRMFGTGKRWSRQVRVDQLAHDAEDIIEALADSLGTTPQTAVADYVFLPPRVPVRTQIAVSRCLTLAPQDGRDYWYFRDLWAVFDPNDFTFGAPAIGWFGYGATGLGFGMYPFWIDRAMWATRLFGGPGCVGGQFAPPGALRWRPLRFAMGGVRGPADVATAPGTVSPESATPFAPAPEKPRPPKLPTDGPELGPGTELRVTAATGSAGEPWGDGTERSPRFKDGASPRAKGAGEGALRLRAEPLATDGSSPAEGGAAWPKGDGGVRAPGAGARGYRVYDVGMDGKSPKARSGSERFQGKGSESVRASGAPGTRSDRGGFDKRERAPSAARTKAEGSAGGKISSGATANTGGEVRKP